MSINREGFYSSYLHSLLQISLFWNCSTALSYWERILSVCRKGSAVFHFKHIKVWILYYGNMGRIFDVLHAVYVNQEWAELPLATGGWPPKWLVPDGDLCNVHTRQWSGAAQTTQLSLPENAGIGTTALLSLLGSPLWLAVNRSCLLEIGRVGCAIPRDNEYTRLLCPFILRTETEGMFTSSSYLARSVVRWKHPWSKHKHPFCAPGTGIGAGR